MTEILLVVLGKSPHLELEAPAPRSRARLEALETLLYLGEEAGLRVLPVGHEIDAALDLPPHDLGDGAREQVGVSGLIVPLSAQPRAQRIEQRMRARQAPDVRRANVIGALLQAQTATLPVRLLLRPNALYSS